MSGRTNKTTLKGAESNSSITMTNFSNLNLQLLSKSISNTLWCKLIQDTHRHFFYNIQLQCTSDVYITNIFKLLSRFKIITETILDLPSFVLCMYNALEEKKRNGLSVMWMKRFGEDICVTLTKINNYKDTVDCVSNTNSSIENISTTDCHVKVNDNSVVEVISGILDEYRTCVYHGLVTVKDRVIWIINMCENIKNTYEKLNNNKTIHEDIQTLAKGFGYTTSIHQYRRDMQQIYEQLTNKEYKQLKKEYLKVYDISRKQFNNKCCKQYQIWKKNNNKIAKNTDIQENKTSNFTTNIFTKSEEIQNILNDIAELIDTTKFISDVKPIIQTNYHIVEETDYQIDKLYTHRLDFTSENNECYNGIEMEEELTDYTTSSIFSITNDTDSQNIDYIPTYSINNDTEVDSTITDIDINIQEILNSKNTYNIKVNNKVEFIKPQPKFTSPVMQEKPELAEYNFLHQNNQFHINNLNIECNNNNKDEDNDVNITEIDINVTDDTYDNRIIGGATFKSESILQVAIRANIPQPTQEDYDYARQLSDQNVPRIQIIERVKARRANIKNIKKQEESNIRDIKRRSLNTQILEQTKILQERQERIKRTNPKYQSNIVGLSSLTHQQKSQIRKFIYEVPTFYSTDKLDLALRSLLNDIKSDVNINISPMKASHIQIFGEYEYGIRALPAQNTWSDAVDSFMSDLFEKMAKYEEVSNVILNKIHVNIYLLHTIILDEKGNEIIIGSGTKHRKNKKPQNTEILKEEKIQEEQEYIEDNDKDIYINLNDYFKINIKSRTNCMYQSVAIASGWMKYPKLLHDKKVQKESGRQIKEKAGFEHSSYSDINDIKLLANYKKINIEVYNTEGLLLTNISPDNLNIQNIQSVKIILENHHFQPLISKQDMIESGYKIAEEVSKKKEIEKILKMELKYKEARIVSYDIETRPDKIGDGLSDSYPYAIGWAFIVKDIGEEKELEDLGYSIDVVELSGKVYIVAYMHIIGDRCLDTFLDKIQIEQLRGAVFYAHNGGKFDIHVIYKHSNILTRDDIEVYGYNKGSIVLNNRIIQLNVRIKNMTKTEQAKRGNKTINIKKHNEISFRDSYPIFQNKLADICKDLKVPHQKLEEKLDVHRRINKDNWKQLWVEEKLDIYLKHDVLGLLECLILQNDIINQKVGIHITQIITAASLAKKYFYGKCYNPKNSNEAIFELEPLMESFIRKAYTGGRVEAFVSKELIEQMLYYYDFTSLYPFQYLEDMPTGRPKWIQNPENEINVKIINNVWNYRIVKGIKANKVAFWHVLVKSPLAAQGTPQNKKPLLGAKEGHEYLFRWFSEETELWLTELEIQKAIDLGLDYEFTPVNGIIFEKSKLLAKCAEELFAEKQKANLEGNAALEFQAKIVLNSIYGMFGLKREDRETLEICSTLHSSWQLALVQGKLLGVEEIGNHIITRKLQDIEVKRTNVAISAWVTSLARIQLYETMNKIEQQGGTVYYCDTDSIITNYKIENSTLEKELMGVGKGKNLGELKNECVSKYEKALKKKKIEINKEDIPLGFKRGIIVNPKTYYVESDYNIIAKACKGYTEREDKPETKLTYESYLKMLNSEHRIPALQFLASNSRAILGGGVTLREHFKSFKQKINKGILQPDGVVLPYLNKKEKIHK